MTYFFSFRFMKVYLNFSKWICLDVTTLCYSKTENVTGQHTLTLDL